MVNPKKTSLTIKKKQFLYGKSIIFSGSWIPRVFHAWPSAFSVVHRCRLAKMTRLASSRAAKTPAHQADMETTGGFATHKNWEVYNEEKPDYIIEKWNMHIYICIYIYYIYIYVMKNEDLS